MLKTIKGLRLQILLLGRRNVGKSSLLNALTHEAAAIVSEQAGSTTDPIEKASELPPLGPILWIDSAGIDDNGELGRVRVAKTLHTLQRADLALLIYDGDWGETEEYCLKRCQDAQVPVLRVQNKAETLLRADPNAAPPLGAASGPTTDAKSLQISAKEKLGLDALRNAIIQHFQSQNPREERLIADIIPQKARVLLVTPIDSAAPKGRLILPQVQTLRELLDAHAQVSLCQVEEVTALLENLKSPPELVIADAQAFDALIPLLPPELPLTSFSILFARAKGDLPTLAKAAKTLSKLKAGDHILIAEACSHHPTHDDIARVQLPKLLAKRAGGELHCHCINSPELPKNLNHYALVIHCGACLWTRRQMLSRMQNVQKQNCPITNFGLALAEVHGILERALKPFPEAYQAYREA